ncbi:MAG: hypothetical protein ACLPHP_22195 [Candidatus Sulfotelmatobacter sp.]
MDFNIRAISLVEGVSADARVDVGSVLGKEVQFRAGLPYSIKLPDDASKLARLPDAEKLLTALDGWARVYVHPADNAQMIHVLAPAENTDGEIVFYRLDLMQQRRSRRGPKPSVEAVGGAVMTYEECATWLMELSANWRANPAHKNHRFVRSRACGIKANKFRLAWVIPEVVGGRAIRERLLAIGDAYGVDIVHVPPRDFNDTKGRLAKLLPYDGVVICRHFAPHITGGAVPQKVPVELIHFCDSVGLPDLEAQIRVWVEVVAEELESRRQYQLVDEEEFLLALMVRAMVSHSKIGEFSHCPRETVLKVVRARHLNVPAADRVLDKNCEQHEDTKTSASLFLWKEHHDGRQYFLNPKRVGEIKPVTANSS